MVKNLQFIHSIKQIIALLLVIVIIAGNGITVFAENEKTDDSYNADETDDDRDMFVGWDSEAIDDALDVYGVTDWTEFEDDLIFESMASIVEAVHISSETRAMENDVKRVVLDSPLVTSHDKTKYIEIMLSMIEVLSQGKPSEEDPCNVLTYFDPEAEGMSRERSIAILFERLVASESEYNRTHKKRADITSKSNELDLVLTGVMMGTKYVSDKDRTLYSAKDVKKYYKDNEEDYGSIEPIFNFADAVDSYYKTIEIKSHVVNASGTYDVSNIEDYDGEITAAMKKICQNAANNNGTRPCTPSYCAAWVSGIYEKSGFGYPGGDAYQFWTRWSGSGSSSPNKIPPGAVVVGSGSGSSAGNTYGHVGIYVGNNTVYDNWGYHRKTTLAQWISSNKGTCKNLNNRKGFIGWVWPYGRSLC